MIIKEIVVGRLKNDCDTLLNVKLPRALENISDEKGVNTYRNLIKALADNIKLIEELEKDDYRIKCGITKGVFDTDSIECVSNEKHCSLPKMDIDLFTKNTDDNNKYIWFKKMVGTIVNNNEEISQITIPVTETTRGVGKTTLLVMEAIKNNGVVIVNSRSYFDYIRECVSDKVKVVYTEPELTGIPKSTPLYIEETVAWDKIKHAAEKHPYLRFKYCGVEVK